MFTVKQQGRKPLKTITILYFLLLGIPSISYAESTQSSNNLLVTLPPLAGLVSWLAPQINVQCLLPNNADPHHFQLKPKQINALQKTKLLVRSLPDDKHWSSLNIAKNTFSLWDTQKNTTATATHAWLNPKQVQQSLPELGKKLQKTFPKYKNDIQQQLHQAEKQATNVWQQWQQLIQNTKLKQYGVIMQHPSWKGMFEALGVPVRFVLESEQHGQEYGPRKLEKALHILEQFPQTILIADSKHSNRALTWLNKGQKHRIIKLDALGQCGDSWLTLMQKNMQQLNDLKANTP